MSSHPSPHAEGAAVPATALARGERWRRVAVLLASTLVGMALGVAGDFAASGAPPSLRDVQGALVLAPITVTCGGGVTAVGQAHPSVGMTLALGGLLFWPVYVWLARRWLARGTPWLWLLVALWCTQGFFQVVHRLWALMSV